MISYELAKKLKEAGFPKSEDWTDEGYGFSVPAGERNSVPTLSEIIEACGDDFRWLKYNHHNKRFLAQGRPHPITSPDLRVIAKTPEESMANLWLLLNSK